MAELTVPGLAEAGHPDDLPTAPATNGPIDPRAVRVRLGGSSQAGEEAALRIAPAGEPRRTADPTDGTGPSGGGSGPDVPARGDGVGGAAVLAQRQPVLVDGEPADVTLRATGPGRYVLVERGVPTRVILESPTPVGGGFLRREVLVDGFRFEVETEPERLAALRERATRGRAAGAHTGPLEVKSIIPGKVVAVSVVAGDAVTAGQQLLVVEAMKMQNELRAPRDGTISRVGVAPGATIEVGDLLLVIS